MQEFRFSFFEVPDMEPHIPWPCSVTNTMADIRGGLYAASVLNNPFTETSSKLDRLKAVIFLCPTLRLRMETICSNTPRKK